jgi:hypothetical protein
MKRSVQSSHQEEINVSSLKITCVGCDKPKKMERLICDECVAEYEAVSQAKKGN